ncbi:uncharacterized protein [Coffea arabica]|uniref:Uncharacterized protein n=1 Tax=Coffea arabica TaxID=13443 RepID=A0ABM4VYS2_COFAR
MQGSLLRILCSKLLATRRGIQDWNKQSFGNVFDAVREVEAGVLRAEAAVENEASEEAQIELQRAQAELTRSLAIKEQFWRQKARVKWLRSGDRNTKYFHAMVKQRRVHEMIHRIRKADGQWVEDNDAIANEVIAHFSDLFSGDMTYVSGGLLHLISSLITGEDNLMLEEAPTLEKVKCVVFAMDGDSATGPNGYTGRFFTFAWDIIASDVHRAVLRFYQNSSPLNRRGLSKGVNRHTLRRLVRLCCVESSPENLSFFPGGGETYLGQACFDIHSSTFAGSDCDTNLGVKNGGKGRAHRFGQVFYGLNTAEIFTHVKLS